MASGRDRLLFIDAIKAVAAQLIVLHHLAWYGPMSDVASHLSPRLDDLFAWLAEYGRFAVAAFLAVSGFLAAQTLSPRGLPAGRAPLCLILQRYARLVGPYAIALLLAVASASLARRWMAHDSIGAPVDAGQFLAHLFLLHDLLEYEALSAGVWYIAIDFQLYALLVLLLWAGARLERRPASADFAGRFPFCAILIAVMASVSLFVFNRDTRWDDLAFYFFGIYALGLAAGWSLRAARPYPVLLGMAVLALAALAFEFRPRLAVAAGTALLLGLAQLHWRSHWLPIGSQVLSRLGNASYALFLVHFPVCLIVNAAFQRLAPEDPRFNALGVLAAWLLSNAAALVFYRHVELRVVPRLLRFVPCRQA